MSQVHWIDGTTGDWSDAADWNTGNVPGSNDAVTLGGVESYEVSVTGAIAVASLTISNAEATLHIATPEETDAISGNLNNAGTLYLDVENGQGGSSLTVGGILTNSGTLQVGNGFYQNLDATSTITTKHLVNTGEIDLLGNTTSGTTNQATLNVTGDIVPNILTGVTLDLKGDALLEYAGGGITTISSDATLTLDGAESRIADRSHPTINSALAGLSDNEGSLTLGDGVSLGNNAVAFTNNGTYTIFNNVALKTNSNFTNSGNVYFDSGDNQGGSSLTVAGTLTNSGVFQVGSGFYQNLTASSIVTTAHLANTGTINLLGNTTAGTSNQATLYVTGDAAANTLTDQSINLKGDALLEFASGGITTVAADAQLTLDGAQSRVADKNHLTTNSALTGLSDNAGTLSLGDGASIANSAVAFTNSGTYTIFNNVAVKTKLDFTNTGTVYVDSDDQQGGSSLTVSGTLTNSGTLQVGSSFYQNLGANSTVTTAHLDNTDVIDLFGNTTLGTTNQATLNDTGDAAPGTLASGVSINLKGDALLEFASSGITTISDGAQLTLDGAQSRVADRSHPATNTALTGLSDNAGTLSLGDGASIANSAVAFTNSGTYTIFNDVAVKTTSNFTNNGTVYIDSGDNQGGSTLTVAGTLTNSGTLQVGSGFYQNLSANSTVTAAHLANTGEIDLLGNTISGTANQATLNVTGDAAPGTLASGVSINLKGDALLEFASGGIASISGGAQLTLDGAQARIADKGHLTTDSALTGLDNNAGILSLSDGASIADVAATFANSGTISISAVNGVGSSSLTTVHLANAGEIDLLGDTTPGTTFQAMLNVTGDAVPGTLASGASINLTGDALLEFASGGITSISSGAQLTLDSAQSFVADKNSLTSNSALAGLNNNAGYLEVANGAVLTTNHGINFTNSGGIDVDDDPDLGGTINLGGKLTNTSTGTITLDGSLGNVATLIVNGNASNSGNLTIGDPAADDTYAVVTLIGADTYSQLAGQTEILGTLMATSVVVSGGLLEASGTVAGNVSVTGGDIAGGLITESTFGTMTIQGSYTQASAGTLETMILADGSGQSTSVDVSGGAAHLNGTLALTIENPQNLSVGETFTVMTFASGNLHGQFTAITDGSATGSGTSIDLGNGFTLDASYDNSAGNVQLTVVASPGDAATMREVAGHDVFDFSANAVGPSYRMIDNFNAATDRLHFWFGVTGVDASVSAQNFSDLSGVANAAHLESHHALLFTPTGGSAAGETFLIVDVNGTAGFQAGQDVVIQLEGQCHMADFGMGNFA